MALIKVIAISFLTLLNLSVFSQNSDYSKDSLIAQQLIVTRLQSLNAYNYLYLFSDAGVIFIIYDDKGKIKANKGHFRESRKLTFKKNRFSKEDRLNFNRCMRMISKDTTVSFSNCNDIVHSFSKVVFFANKRQHYLKVDFTSDCLRRLDENGMGMLRSIYRHLFVR